MAAATAGVCPLVHRPAAWAGDTGDDPQPRGENAVELISITFDSDYTPDYGPLGARYFAWLWDKDDHWSDPKAPPNVIYQEPEWTKARSYPVVQTRGTTLLLAVKLDVNMDQPGPYNYTLTGQGGEAYLTFSASGSWASDGEKVVGNVQANEPIPNTVGVIGDEMISWTITINGEGYDLDDSGPHTVFRTYAEPKKDYKEWMQYNYMSHRRAEGCCAIAEGNASIEQVADSLWNTFGDNDPPYEPFEKPEVLVGPSSWRRCWELMDGEVAGQCDPQAALMASACNLLGLEAKLRLVHASEDAGEGKCLDLDDDEIGGHQVYLLLDAAVGPGFSIQRWEGCAAVPSGSGHYYAVWPNLKAAHDYAMLMTLKDRGWTQWWCRSTVDGWVPVQQRDFP